MKTLCNLLVVCACAAFFSGCGTTSSMKPAAGSAVRNLHKYNQVRVLDFGNKTKNKSDAGAQYVQMQGRRFADLIALHLEKTGAFEKVVRDAATPPGGLLIKGDITRCVEGSAAMRYLVGMGAGSSGHYE